MKPQVSIVILNYNTPELTTACVQSLIAHTAEISYEIIVVENGSKPASREYFEQYLTDLPYVHAVYSENNLGFG